MSTQEDLGRTAYEAYVRASRGVSLVSGDQLPSWEDAPENVRVAWRMSAGAVMAAVGQDYLARAILEALCRRQRLSLDSAAEPGTPARNYELALRLGIGHVFGLEPQARDWKEDR